MNEEKFNLKETIFLLSEEKISHIDISLEENGWVIETYRINSISKRQYDNGAEGFTVTKKEISKSEVDEIYKHVSSAKNLKTFRGKSIIFSSSPYHMVIAIKNYSIYENFATNEDERSLDSVSKLDIFKKDFSYLFDFLLDAYSEATVKRGVAINVSRFEKKFIGGTIFYELDRQILDTFDSDKKIIQLDNDIIMPSFFRSNLFYGLDIELGIFILKNTAEADIVVKFSDNENNSIDLFGNDTISNKHISILSVPSPENQYYKMRIDIKNFISPYFKAPRIGN